MTVNQIYFHLNKLILGPMVGLHIRRTDKLLGDSRLYLIEEYFQWADLYFDINDRRKNTKLKRRVYIATDDPSAIKEARQKYVKFKRNYDLIILDILTTKYLETQKLRKAQILRRDIPMLLFLV
jgi:hypothetical protein